MLLYVCMHTFTILHGAFNFFVVKLLLLSLVRAGAPSIDSRGADSVPGFGSLNT